MRTACYTTSVPSLGITAAISPQPLSAEAGGLLVLEEVYLHIVGCFQTVQAVSLSGYVRGSKGELSPILRQHHALADHTFRLPEWDVSDHM